MIDALVQTNNHPLAALPASASSRAHDTFSHALSQRTSRITATNAANVPTTKTEQLREAAGQLVATAFLLPLMKEARSSTFKSDLFGGGFAEDAMQEKLDVAITDELAASDRFPLTDALVDHLDRTV
ncbi:MAG: rod-binding protein [Planctomycetota bacterium]